jgi:formamidopyrimidine-DNA glycosylase
MPELPEVETTLRGVQPLVEKRTVSAVVVRQRQLRWPVSHGLHQKIHGRKILSVNRRAKYILLRFTNGTLMIHLGMSGRLQVLPVAVSPGKHDHVDIVLSTGRVLRFHDPRRFGSVLWINGDPLVSPLLAHLGPEPFDEVFCGRMLFEAARGRRIAVKSFIMDGRIVVGVGNIYASEALFRAGIRPTRAAGRVALHRYERLVETIRGVLSQAIAAGGTTLRDYSRVNGEPGYFEQALQVYEKSGEPCVNCGDAIRRKVIGQRASYYCASCQH